MRTHPVFCDDCWKVEECHQKENMLADTEPRQGYVVFDSGGDGSHVCSLCLEESPARDGETVYELGSDERLDSPTHCEDCGAPLKHGLTNDGVEYVLESFDEKGGCCRELWPRIWAPYIEQTYPEMWTEYRER